jgi:hypothetical protein
VPVPPTLGEAAACAMVGDSVVVLRGADGRSTAVRVADGAVVGAGRCDAAP